MEKTCRLDYCEKKVDPRHALCRRHRAQRERGEQLRPFPPKRTLEDRFWEKVDKTETCWIWTASTKDSGYGQLVVNNRPRVAHRISYQMHKGDIPAGMFVDHVCHQRRCVNPDHLRLATNKQNLENRSGPPRNNTSGIIGVSRQGNKWYAKVEHHKHQYYVGLFDHIEDAEAAVIAKRLELFTHNDADRMAA